MRRSSDDGLTLTLPLPGGGLERRQELRSSIGASISWSRTDRTAWDENEQYESTMKKYDRNEQRHVMNIMIYKLKGALGHVERRLRHEHREDEPER
eukprot:11070683-Heterocapsa_arctica.AAC.1